MTYPRIYRSTQLNAPVLSGTAGALISVLDACLVNGLPSMAVGSLTQAGGVATATVSTGHAVAIGDVIQIQGAAEADYNVTARVTAITATSVSFPVNPAAPASATGTITLRIPPAGWSKPFTGTNKGAYRNAIPTAYLRVRDDAPNATQAGRMAWVWMYEAMTDVDTGSGGSMSGAAAWTATIYKSTAASTAARAWLLVATDRAFWFLPDYEATNRWTPYGFGDFPSYKPNDDFRQFLFGGNTPAITSTFGGDTKDVWTTNPFPAQFDNESTTQWGMTFLRPASGVDQQAVSGRYCSGFNYVATSSPQTANKGGSINLGTANPAGGDLIIDRLQLWENVGSTAALRGVCPGLYVVANNMNGSLGSTGWALLDCQFAPSDSRKCLFFHPQQPGNPQSRALAIDVSQAWE